MSAILHFLSIWGYPSSCLTPDDLGECQVDGFGRDDCGEFDIVPLAVENPIGKVHFSKKYKKEAQKGAGIDDTAFEG